MTILAWFIAFILDLLIGDPAHWPHPVRLIGRLIKRVESVIRVTCTTPRARFWGGVILWCVVVGLSWLVCSVLIDFAFALHDVVGYLLEIILIYTCLATKCLKEAAYQVYEALKKGDLALSRERLAWIVGRDTDELTPEQITQAVTETVAENTVDGVIAPLFFLMLAGAPAAMAYKAINTLDSMVGYKNEKYRDIGCFSAKMDDVANFIPARLSWLFLTLAAWCLKLDYKQAWRIGQRDHTQHSSPNSGWPEATVAGALGVQLGGPNRYFGQWIDKPWIGDASQPISLDAIPKTTQLMLLASCAALVLFAVVTLLAQLVI